jgi:hypothetical protein
LLGPAGADVDFEDLAGNTFRDTEFVSQRVEPLYSGAIRIVLERADADTLTERRSTSRINIVPDHACPFA